MPASLPCLLIVEDRKSDREGLCDYLKEDFKVTAVSGDKEALSLLGQQAFDVVLTDLRLLGGSGLNVVDTAAALPKRPVVIMMTAYGTVQLAVEAMKRGASDFITKPFELKALKLKLHWALKKKEQAQPKEPSKTLLGKSEAFQKLLDRLDVLAQTDATVLIEGETGTGKELVARLLHEKSTRRQGPFVPVNCAAIPVDLIESELFGYQKGAFTGAVSSKLGYFKAAHRGTLFLDEVGEMDLSTQVKLLRFLEDKTFVPLGSSKEQTADLRLLCATHRNLESRVRSGEFREDLLYRIHVVPLRLPALRQRKGDIAFLLHHFLKDFSNKHHLKPVTLSPQALAVLEAYSWPGNVRELRNLCESLSVLEAGGVVSKDSLSPRFQIPEQPSGGFSRQEKEKLWLASALRETQGNLSQAAKLLGISRSTLHRKMARYPDLEQVRRNL